MHYKKKEKKRERKGEQKSTAIQNVAGFFSNCLRFILKISKYYTVDLSIKKRFVLFCFVFISTAKVKQTSSLHGAGDL